MMKLVHEFYGKYVAMLKNNTSSGKEKDIKNQPRLDILWVQDIEVGISI